MADDAIIPAAIRAAGIDEIRSLGKSREILRLLNMKLPIGCLKRAEACRHVLAIEIACRLLSLDFDKNRLISQALVPPKVYQEALVSCKNILNLKWESASVIDVLAVQFGLQLKPIAYQVLEQYKTRYIDKLDKVRQQFIDPSAPVYQAAAFFIGAKGKKLNIDKNRIAQIAEVDPSFFRTVIGSIDKALAPSSATVSSSSTYLDAESGDPAIGAANATLTGNQQGKGAIIGSKRPAPLKSGIFVVHSRTIAWNNIPKSASAIISSSSDSSGRDPPITVSREQGQYQGQGHGQGPKNGDSEGDGATISINGVEYPVFPTSTHWQNENNVHVCNTGTGAVTKKTTDKDRPLSSGQSKLVAGTDTSIGAGSSAGAVTIEEHRRHRADHLFAAKRQRDEADAAEDAKAKADAAVNIKAKKTVMLDSYKRLVGKRSFTDRN